MKQKKYETRVWKPFQRKAYHEAWADKKIFGVLWEFGRDLRRCHKRIWRGYCDDDIFAIDAWFLGLMPTMLEDFRDHLHGYPESEDLKPQTLTITDEEKTSEGMLAWKAVLNRMIFLLREADEETCKRINPYAAEYAQARTEFEKKYGSFGEKLHAGNDRSDFTIVKGRRICFPGDTEEYREVSDKYFEEREKLERYRRECKDEALALFSKWFYALWD